LVPSGFLSSEMGFFFYHFPLGMGPFTGVLDTPEKALGSDQGLHFLQKEKILRSLTFMVLISNVLYFFFFLVK